MSQDKMREEFEAWVLSKYPNQHMGKFATGEYHSTTVDYCWLAWQASREGLVIELPEGQCLFQRSAGRAPGGLPLIELGAVAAELESAGVKFEVKP